MDKEQRQEKKQHFCLSFSLLTAEVRRKKTNALPTELYEMMCDNKFIKGASKITKGHYEHTHTARGETLSGNVAEAHFLFCFNKNYERPLTIKS